MKWLIALLTAATGLLHILVGFGVIAGGGGGTNWLLVLNGVGYLVLLVLYWTATGGRGTIRWILLAYTLITLIGYFVLNAGNNYGLNNTIGLVIKAIELLLVILLFLDRGSDSDRVAVQAPAASRTAAPTMSTRSVEAPTADATLTGMASSAAAGVSAAAAGAAAGVAALGDEVEERVDEAGDYVADVADEVVDTAGDALDATGDALRGGAVAVGAALDEAGDKVEDILDGDAAAMDAADLAAEPTAEELRAELEEYLRSFGSGSEFRKEIEYIEGIGAVYGQKLRDVGIATVLDLMVNGATRRGRKQISDQSGISQSMILTWVNHVDLFRIKGVAQEYADLLEQSGVDTVVELAQRNPANLHKRMLDINEQKKLVRRPPHASEVQSWVEQAKGLRRIVYY